MGGKGGERVGDRERGKRGGKKRRDRERENYEVVEGDCKVKGRRERERSETMF